MKTFPFEVYEKLKEIVGDDYVSIEDEVCRCYIKGGDMIDTLYERALTKPACVVLPANTVEVQKIVKLCNRYCLPFIPISTFWGTYCGAKDPKAIAIDLKRMNRLEIDETNMYAVVEPGVTYAQLLGETMKKGLYTLCPGGGAQASVLANHLNYSYSPICYRVGLPYRRILGLEWVLPTGEITRLGSICVGEKYFWGEGPGPDLRGLLRGEIGWLGHAGIVTKMAVKLFPLPEELVPEGVTPKTFLKLPSTRMKWYNITLPNFETLIKAMHKIAESGIGTVVMKVPIVWRYRAKASSKEDFWEIWMKDEEVLRKSRPCILRVLLVGYTSEEQLKYEENVLHDVISELGGEFRRTRQTDEALFKVANSVGMWWPTGGYVSIEFVFESLRHAIERGKTLAKVKEHFTPPTMDEFGEEGWIFQAEMGHTTYLEFLIQWDPDETGNDLMTYRIWKESQQSAIREKQYTSQLGSRSFLKITGPAYGPNYHILLEKVRKMLDPRNLSNPPPDINDKLAKKFKLFKNCSSR